MAKTFYVIDKQRQFTTHQGDANSCAQYVNNVVDLWGHDPKRYEVAEGAKQRDAMLKAIKENRNRD